MKDQFLITTEHPVLRDHVVHGRHVLPGLAYVDLVYQFLRSAGRSIDQWELKDLSIYEPLVVSAAAPVVLTIEAAHETHDALRILVHSAPQSNPQQSRRHVVVQACRTAQVEFGERLDIAAALAEATPMDINKIYEHYRDLGLAHGEFMRVNGHVYVTSDAVYTQLDALPSVRDVASQMLFNPALLDGAAVCGSVGLAYAKALSSRRLSLPVYFKGFRACALLQDGCFARLKTDQVRRRNEMSYVSVEFFDRDGRKIAELEDLGGTSGLEQSAVSSPATLVEPAPTAHERAQRMLQQWFAEQGHTVPQDVDASAGFAELGMDSTGLLKLLQQLEKKLSTTLSPTLLFEYSNVRELAAYLAETHAAAIEAIEWPVESSPHVSPQAPLAQESGYDSGATVAEYLRTSFAKQLGIEAELVRTDASFSELGFDSAGLLSLLQLIESDAAAGLSPTLLFEYQNLQELAEYLTVHHGPALLKASARREQEAVTHSPPTIRDSASESSTGTAMKGAVDRNLGYAPNATRAGATSMLREQDVAIVGISGRFPGAASVEQLWDVLEHGKDCITLIPPERWDYNAHRDTEESCRWGEIEFGHWGGFIADADQFDPAFFQIQPINAQCLDPQERLFLQTSWHLLENAGYTRERIKHDHKGRVGVYVGAMYNDYTHVEGEISQEVGAFLSLHSSIANRVSHFFDFNGPSLALNTMCSSSAVALHTACRDLAFGDCELALVGGVNLSLHHKKFIGLSHEKQIGTHQGARSFCEAGGYLPAEAIVAVLLKPALQAIQDGDRILGVIKSSAVNHSGRSNGYTVPNPTAQAQVIEEALARSGLSADDIDYIEATSNGAMLGDPMELVALHRVLAKRKDPAPVPIGTVKSNIGHAEGASALTQLAKVLLQLEHGRLPQTIKTEPLNPLSQWPASLRLVKQGEEWARCTTQRSGQSAAKRVLLNSFGAGGTNASLVIEEFFRPRSAESTSAGRKEIVVLSARTADRLPIMLRELLKALQRHPRLSLQDIAYTLQVGREAMQARAALVVGSREELLTVIEQALRFNLDNDGAWPADLPLVFGNGRATRALKDLIEGTAGQAMMESLLKDNDAHRVALLWTQGASVPWRSLQRQGAQLVALPGYPFATERYWLSPRGQAALPGVAAPSIVDSATRSRVEFTPASDIDILLDDELCDVAPRNDLERTIAQIWEQSLDVHDVGVTDNFFELGGNSLVAGVVIARCSEAFNVEIDWGILLGADPTIEGFARAIVSKLADGNERELEAVLANS